MEDQNQLDWFENSADFEVCGKVLQGLQFVQDQHVILQWVFSESSVFALFPALPRLEPRQNRNW